MKYTQYIIIVLLVFRGIGGAAEAPSTGAHDSTNAHAIATFGKDASLADYLAYGSLHNPGLEAAFDRWKAALERVDQRKALPNPNFTYAYFLESVETRVGPQSYKIGVMQAYPWFGKRALRGRVADADADVAFRHYEAARTRLYFKIKHAYYEYAYLYRAIAITEENIGLLTRLEGVAQSKLRAGGSQASVIKAQLELGRLDDRVRSLREMRGPIMSRLNAGLNRTHDALLPWPKDVPATDPPIDEAKLFERLPDTSPELRALDSLVEKSEQSIALAKKAYYPDFKLGVNYVATDDALNPGVQDSGKDPIMAAVAIDIPIWRGVYKAGVSEAKHTLRAAETSRAERGNTLDADLKLALYRLRDAKRKLDLYRDTLVPQAEQALNVSEEVYRTGKGDFLDLIDAERLLLEFKLASERAFVDREIAIAEIEELIGGPIDGHAIKTGDK